MASISEMMDLAKAQSPRNGLAEMAQHFVVGADAGYDAGQKAKLQQYDQILKASQALEAQQKARALEIQNKLWQSFIDDSKMQGKVPLTAGEVMAGRKVATDNIGGTSTNPKGADSLSRIAQMFQGQDGEYNADNVTLNLPGGSGSVKLVRKGAVKPGRIPNPLPAEIENRIVWEKATTRALAMAQAENPLATQDDAKKYYRVAFESLGKNPNDYIKNTDSKPPPALNTDPWGLLGNSGGKNP